MLAALALPMTAPAENALRVVPPAALKILDPYATTATITPMHGQMIYDQLFAAEFEARTEAADGPAGL
jgi:hypothetical protein